MKGLLLLPALAVFTSAFAFVPAPADMKGPFPILSAPYEDDGSLDLVTLAKEIRWVDDCGCPGVIWCQANDQIDLLSTEEKFRSFEAAAAAAEGRRVTLAIGANGTNVTEMLEIAAEIERVAARHPAAKIAMISRPPDDTRTMDALEAAWDRLGAVAKRPVIFQTYCSDKTPTPSVEMIVRLAKRHPLPFGYIKEEAAGNGANERMVRENAAKPDIKTVMAGWGGWQWLYQLRQCGCEGLVTERCAHAPLLACIWRRHLEGDPKGDLAAAYAMYRLLIDQRNFAGGGLRGYNLYFLMKEGVFKNLVSREYDKGRVTEGGSFGSGRAWKLSKLEIPARQRAELDLLYADMMRFAKPPPASAASWIGDGLPDRDGADWYDEDPAAEFRAEVVLPEGLAETKVRFACAGFGGFDIGGTGLSSDGLDTFWSVYDKTVYSFSTPALRVGAAGALKPFPATNTVRVVLGNGFYNLPPLLFWGHRLFRSAVAHGRPCFRLSIDGVTEPLDWTWRRTNVIRNSPYLGTEIDATRPEDPCWKPAVAVKGPKGRIVDWPSTKPRMGVFAHHRGAAKWLKEGAVQVVDFGVNASGVPELTFDGEARGTRVEIVYGERLNADGSVNVLTQTAGQIKSAGKGGPGAPDVACQRDAYVCGGGRESFRPPFTWHICRYAEIRGARHLVAGPTLHVRSMVSTETGLAPAARAFRTDDPDLRRLHEICQRTFQANLIGGVQSDCPGRERLGYGGDIVATCEAMCLNFDMKEIYLKILRDFADEAADDGWITETAPFVGIAVGSGLSGDGAKRAGPLSWTVAVPVLMETVMRHYPDARDRALAFYPTCARYVRQVDAAFPSGIVPCCIGDHEALERAPNDVTATAHWHEFVRLTASFAQQLGKTDDQRAFEAIARKVAAAFAAKFVHGGTVANGTQSAQAIGLQLGLVPADQVAAAERRLVAAVEEKGCAPTTGIFATRYMLVYLAEHGRNDLARRIVLHRGFPGWLNMADSGATTLWETWKESDNVYSNCHPMFGSVDEWILRFGRAGDGR